MNDQTKHKTTSWPRQLWNHALSLLTSLLAMLNLCFWLFPLTLLVLLKAIPLPPLRRLATRGLELCYWLTVRCNSFWLLDVLNVQVEVFGQLPDHPAPIVIANHQSWFDVPLLLQVVTVEGKLIVKFFVKQELVWVPVIGWICIAMNFPRLRRGQTPDSQQKDRETIEQLSKTLARESGALQIFPEGTRFTAQKREAQNSPYQHLLRPKPGGVKYSLASAPPGTPVVDITFVYDGDSNFWHCLHGGTKKIRAYIKVIEGAESDTAREWLGDRWREKDALFSQAENHQSLPP
ncbi:MAG: 1-acyl-sn-glycerol-3-phosphate acyltransferase [Pseudomonadales bacterium]